MIYVVRAARHEVDAAIPALIMGWRLLRHSEPQVAQCQLSKVDVCRGWPRKRLSQAGKPMILDTLASVKRGTSAITVSVSQEASAACIAALLRNV